MPLRLLPIALCFPIGCSDYGFGGKTDHPGADSDSGYDPSAHSDSAGDSTNGETGSVPVGDDGCYDPGTAYDTHPAAALVVTQPDIGFDITFEGSSAGYTSELWLWEPLQVYVGTGHVTDTGTNVPVGSFAAGTELKFAIVVTDTGLTYYSGPATRNADGFNHAAVTYAGECRWIVGFEDQYGGGDQDFNDIELAISGPLELRPV